MLLTKEEFREKWGGYRIARGGPGARLMNPFGYHHGSSDADVYVTGNLEEATDGGYGYIAMVRVAPRGSPEETLRWAEEAVAVPPRTPRED